MKKLLVALSFTTLTLPVFADNWNYCYDDEKGIDRECFARKEAATRAYGGVSDHGGIPTGDGTSAYNTVVVDALRVKPSVQYTNSPPPVYYNRVPVLIQKRRQGPSQRHIDELESYRRRMEDDEDIEIDLDSAD